MDKFKLSDNFIEQYKNKRPPFGFNGLGELVYMRTYSRLKEDGANEQWYETCKRVVEGTYNMQKSHIEKYDLGWRAYQAQRSAQEMYTRMFQMKFLPPGRGLWAMGTPITEERNLYAALNNCAFVSTANLKEDLAKPFTFLMDASMLGVGVGFDTVGAGQLTVKGPNEKRGTETFVIPDTREGWVESVRILLESYFLGTATLKFDYSNIRGAGEPIKTFGGISAGYKPLEELHDALRKTLSQEIGSPLSITAIVDIQNHIGKAVVAGNVRRTAEIVFGDPHSQEYLDLKNYNKNPKRADYGWTSNNSIFAELGMKYHDVCERVRLNGEPGFAWLENMRGYSRMKNGPDNKDHRAVGGNPCILGSTLIAVADGRNAVRIDELVDTEYPVYTIDSTGKITIRTAQKTWKTREQTEVIRVVLDDDSSFVCTPDHLVMLRNGTYVEAQNLESGISLKPFNSTKSEKGYRNILGSGKRASGRRQYRLILENAGIDVNSKTHAVHHKNYEKTNDRIENLEIISHKEHNQRHLLLKNPMWNKNTAKKVSETRKRLGIGKGESNPMYGKTHTKATKQKIGTKSYQNWQNQRELMVEAIRKGMDLEAREKISLSRKKELVKVICPVCHAIKLLLPAKAKKFVTCSHSCSNIHRSLVKNEGWNHTVKRVEFAGYEDVYDIYVKDTHNFGIITSSEDSKFVVSSGIFIHNCLEQTLESYELCCLVETFPNNHDDIEDYLRTLKFAYLYAKTVTLGKTHWPETNRVMLRNRRIGCSVSGIQQFVARRGLHQFRDWLERGYKTIQDWDKMYSDWLAIPRSIKTTSVKPSGTVSIVAGATPGLHWPQSRFHIRRIRLSNVSPLIPKLQKAGYHIEKCVGSEDTTAVVEIPVDIGDGVRPIKEVSMWEQLSMAAFMQKYWEDNQVSATITFHPEHEGHEIEHALDYFQYQLKGISFLPNMEEGAYQQMPYEKIDETEYKKRVSKLKKLHFGVIKGEEADQERFCDGETCVLNPELEVK